MRKVLLAGVATCVLVAGAAVAQQTTFVIQGTQVPVYTVTETDARLAEKASQSALDATNATVADHANRIAALEAGGAVQPHTHPTSDVVGLDTALASHGSRLDTIESNLVTMNGQIAARVMISPAAGNDIQAVFMGTQAECNAITPKNATTFYICL